MPSGGTRLDIAAGHVMRIEPALYWQPLARLAIQINLSRVLDDLKQKAEQLSATRHEPDTSVRPAAPV